MQRMTMLKEKEKKLKKNKSMLKKIASKVIKPIKRIFKGNPSMSGKDISDRETVQVTTSTLDTVFDSTYLRLIDHKKPRVLIVDDSHVCLKLLGKHFADLGYVADLFADVLMALDQLRLDTVSSGYEAILTDIFMPNMDGLQFTKYCREDLGIQTPICILSTGIELRSEAAAAGANFFLCKPVQKNKLYEIFGAVYMPSLSPEIEPDIQGRSRENKITSFFVPKGKL